MSKSTNVAQISKRIVCFDELIKTHQCGKAKDKE
jgi:hypothetical protein